MPTFPIQIAVKVRNHFKNQGYGNLEYTRPWQSFEDEDAIAEVNTCDFTDTEKSTVDLIILGNNIMLARTSITEKYTRTYADDFEDTYILLKILKLFECDKFSLTYMQAEEKSRNFLSLFPNAISAENFLINFYNYIGTDKKLETLFELQAADKRPAAMQLLYSLSEHVDEICHEEYRNKFKQLLNHLTSITDFSEESKKSIENALKILMDASMQHYPNISLKQKKKLYGVWREKLNTLNCIPLNVQAAIDIYLEVAACLISAKTMLSPQNTKLLMSIGVKPKELEAFATLEAINSDILIPNYIVANEKYFICKLSYDDIRGPFLGLLTGCCQHLGDAARSSARYGYTQENSGFYIMVKGKAPNFPFNTSKINSNNIVAQSWAWRLPGSNTIVLDSVEMQRINESLESQERQNHARQLFFRLAEKLVLEPVNTTNIKRVMIGSTNGQHATGIKDIGVNITHIKTINSIPAPPNPWYVKTNIYSYITSSDEFIYIDNGPQSLLYDSEFLLEAAISTKQDDIIRMLATSNYDNETKATAKALIEKTENDLKRLSLPLFDLAKNDVNKYKPDIELEPPKKKTRDSVLCDFCLTP